MNSSVGTSVSGVEMTCHAHPHTHTHAMHSQAHTHLSDPRAVPVTQEAFGRLCACSVSARALLCDPARQHVLQNASGGCSGETCERVCVTGRSRRKCDAESSVCRRIARTRGRDGMNTLQHVDAQRCDPVVTLVAWHPDGTRRDNGIRGSHIGHRLWCRSVSVVRQPERS